MINKNLIVAFVFLLMFIPLTVDAKTITATYDGVEIVFEEPPIIENKTTLVPLRTIMETLGLSVNYDNDTKTASLFKDGYNIEITVDDVIAIVNDEEFILSVPAKIIDERMYIPLRFISEALGVGVSWDPNEWIIILDSTGKTVVIDKIDDLLSEYHLYYPDIKNFLYGKGIANEYISILENTKEKLNYQIKISTNDMVKLVNNNLYDYLKHLNDLKTKGIFIDNFYQDDDYRGAKEIMRRFEYESKGYKLVLVLTTDRYQGGGIFDFTLERI